VQSNLSDLKSAKAEFDQATGVVLTRDGELVGFEDERKGTSVVLEVDVRQLQGSLRATGSSDFVKRTQGKTVPETAHNLIASMTPGVLKHNGPLLKQVERDLTAYNKADAACQQAQAESTQAKAQYNRSRSTLQLCLSATLLAWKYHQTRLALAKLNPIQPARRRHAK
jgi:hypothetical protein